MKQAEEMTDEQRGEAGGTFRSYSGNRIYNRVIQRAEWERSPTPHWLRLYVCRGSFSALQLSLLFVLIS